MQYRISLQHRLECLIKGDELCYDWKVTLNISMSTLYQYANYTNFLQCAFSNPGYASNLIRNL